MLIPSSGTRGAFVFTPSPHNEEKRHPPHSPTLPAESPNRLPLQNPRGAVTSNEPRVRRAGAPENTWSSHVATPNRPELESHPQSPQPSFSFKRFQDALRESTSVIASQLKGVIHALFPSTVGKLAAYSTAALGFSSLLAFRPDCAVGLIAISMIVRAGSFENNHHIRVQNCIGQILFATHAALIDAWPAVIASGFAATRNFIQSLTPEDRPGLRFAISAAGFSLGVTVFASCLSVFPLTQLSNLSLVAMALTTTAEAFTKKLSWATRLCYLASSSVMLPYHALMSGSPFGVLVNLISIPNMARTILKHDLRPVANETFQDGLAIPLPAIAPKVPVRAVK